MTVTPPNEPPPRPGFDRYRTKPRTVNAVRLTTQNMPQIAQETGSHWDGTTLWITGPEGELDAYPGQWLIEADDDYWPVDPQDFPQRFTPTEGEQ